MVVYLKKRKRELEKNMIIKIGYYICIAVTVFGGFGVFTANSSQERETYFSITVKFLIISAILLLADIYLVSSPETLAEYPELQKWLSIGLK